MTTGRAVPMESRPSAPATSKTLIVIINCRISIGRYDPDQPFRNTRGFPVWQRTCREHIIRNDRELSRIREYFRENPMKWDMDKEYDHHIEEG
jgi:hypothetical protein